MPSALAYNKDYAFNAICPYYTMFPLEYPMGIIRKHRKQATAVLDPFCGRGTTIYAARKLGLDAYGLDTSPIAAAIAQAKLARATLDAVMSLADALLEEEPRDIPDTAFFRAAFAPSTLKALCSLREGLMKTGVTNEAAILRAAALGCLHGPLPKDRGTPSYFSNQMPRTFSSKPDYSVRYWRDRSMAPPEVSVTAVLRKKLARIHDLDSVTPGRLGNVRTTDAREPASYKGVRKAGVTVTSPPYYGMRTYVADQWLRNWFLGGPATLDYIDERQLRHSGHATFISELAKVWTNVHKASAEDAHLYVRFGAIPSCKSDPRALLKASLEEAKGWKLISVRDASTSEAGKRQAGQMGSVSTPAAEFDFHAVRV